MPALLGALVRRPVLAWDPDPQVLDLWTLPVTTATCLDTAGTLALAKRVERWRPMDFIGIDTETAAGPETRRIFGDKANFVPYAGSYVTGMSVGLSERGSGALDGFYVPVGHESGNVAPEAVQALLWALTVTQARHVFANAVYDWPFLALLGPFVPQPGTIDVQVVRWWQDENAVKGLKEMGEIFLGEDASAEKRALKALMGAPCSTITEARQAVLEAYPELGYTKGKHGTKLHPGPEAEAMAHQLRQARGWHQLAVDELAMYAARDSTLNIEVMDALLPLGEPYDLHPGLERELDLQPVLYGMTKRGISVDIAQLLYASTLYGTLADELGEGLKDEFGLDNPGSSQQVAHLLFDTLDLPVYLRTEGGAPATDKNALEMLQGDPVAGRILEYRKWKHAQGQADGYRNHAEQSFDGRIHGHYASNRTVTGRLSSSGPNVMNTPRDDTNPEIALAFACAEAGSERYRFDLASAELWVTASITNDPVLTEVLLEGRNLHAEMMVQVFGGEADKHRREYTLSKNVNYGIEYGAGLDQIAIFAAKAGFGPKEARKVAKIARDGHKQLFARQHAMADKLAEIARRNGKLPLHIAGRYRHFHSPGKQVGYYTALNALVQGGVAEFMKSTMLEIKARGYEDLLVAQVHDEFWFDGPPGIAQELLDMLTSIANDINPFKYPMIWAQK